MAVDLGKFEGRPVRRTSIAIRNTGDGLSNALKLEPEIIHGGEKRYVVLEVDIEKIRHDPMDDGDAWDRVHMSVASGAAFVPEDLARPYLDGLALRIQEAEAERTGQEALAGTSVMEEQHLAGSHHRKRRACALCYPPEFDPLAEDAQSSNGDGDATVTDIKPARAGRARKARKATKAK